MSDFDDLPEDVRDELELRAATGQLQGVQGAAVQDYDAQQAAYVPRKEDAAAAEEHEDAALAALLARAEGGARRPGGMRYYATCLRCGKSGHLARDCREPLPRRQRDRPRQRRGVVRGRSSPSSSSSSSSSSDESEDERTRRPQQQQQQQQQPVVVGEDDDVVVTGEAGEVYCCNCGERGHEAAGCRKPRFDERDYDVGTNRNRSIAWWKKSRSEAFIFGPRTPVEPALSPSPPPGFESALTGVRGSSSNMRRAHSTNSSSSGGGARHGFRSQPQFARTRSFVCDEADDDGDSSSDDFEFHTDAPHRRRRGGGGGGTPPVPQPASKRRRRHW